ncbi:MAG: phytanoyl-CoA dioxygenase family protein [Elainellaceae cyanobacterium]
MLNNKGSNEQILKEFREKGFVVLKNFFSPEEVDILLERIKNKASEGSEVLTKGAMTFKSQVFLNDDQIQKIISQQKVIDIVQVFAGPNLWVRWDQAVAKGPGAGVFPWHQDNGYNGLRTEFYQFWIALTKTTSDNGALLLQPGSHKKNLPHKKVGNEMVYAGEPENPTLIEAEPGDVTIFSSLMLHSTNPNITEEDRWAYVIEYMRTSDYDPHLKPPYLVVSRDGKSCIDFVYQQEGAKNPINRLKSIFVKSPY